MFHRPEEYIYRIMRYYAHVFIHTVSIKYMFMRIQHKVNICDITWYHIVFMLCYLPLCCPSCFAMHSLYLFLHHVRFQYFVWYYIALSSTVFLAKGQRCKNNPLLCILEAETLLTFILFSASVLRGLAVGSHKHEIICIRMWFSFWS